MKLARESVRVKEKKDGINKQSLHDCFVFIFENQEYIENKRKIPLHLSLVTCFLASSSPFFNPFYF
jgi:hypothetical protein